MWVLCVCVCGVYVNASCHSLYKCLSVYPPVCVYIYRCLCVTVSAGWSGILVIIAAFIQIGAGVCILLPVKRGQLEYATS